MTEQTIKKIFEKRYGVVFANLNDYQAIEYAYFRAGYLALLNELEQTGIPELYRLLEGVEK